MSEAVSVAAMDRVCLITATAAIRAGAMESAAPVEAPAADAAAVATASAGKGATASTAATPTASAAAAASAARIGADRSERQGTRHEKYGYCSLD
jgi:hypothetical protein